MTVIKKIWSLCLLTTVSLHIVHQSAAAQNLDDAVASQLDAIGAQYCARLLAGDSPNVFGTGGLNAICTRPVGFPDPPRPQASPPPGGSPPPPSSSGISFPAALATPGTESTLHEKKEAMASVSNGFFFTIGHDSVDRDPSEFEEGYTSDLIRISSGFDWTLGSTLAVGVAADATEQNGDFGNGGDFRLRTFGLTGFGSYWIGKNSSIDVYAGYSRRADERLRRATFSASANVFDVEGAPTADFNADQFRASLQYSYDWAWGGFTVGPRLGYDWNRTDNGTYSESDSSGLALTFHNDKETSSQFSGGLAGARVFSTQFGVVVLAANVLYRYENGMDQRNVEVSFVEDTRARRFTYQTESPDREFIDIFASTTFVLPNGLQVFLAHRSVASHAFLNVNAGTLGFRKEF